MDGNLDEAGRPAKGASAGGGHGGDAAQGAAAGGAAALLDWFDRHARTLPWRVSPEARRAGERPDPYRIWLSEIMLQQTGVKAVAPYFQAFTRRWPSVAALAAADEAEIMAAWAGLGYYSRARNLIACARTVADLHGGRFPASEEALRALPGIGAYTSAAIAAIAFGEPAVVVDGNVERVMARLHAIATPMPRAKEEIRRCVAAMLPAERPDAFAEALMDLGATICTPRRPACALCPLRPDCLAHARGREEAFPVKAARKSRPTRYGHAFVARRGDGALLLRRRPPRGLLGGMSEVPGSEWAERAGGATPPLAGQWQGAGEVEHVFTHFRLVLGVQRADIAAGIAAPEGHWWAAAESVPGEALPSLMKKVIEAAYPGATQRRREPS